MSMERPTAGTGPGAEPPIAPGAVIADDTGAPGITPAMRLQILSTEHWSLLATRSLAWNESFSRAGMYLSTLSGAMVALALVVQASDRGAGWVVFALAILPIVLFVGVATFIRLGAANYYDAITVVGMNRIRSGYLELAPDLERYFVMSAHDDPAGIAISMGVAPGTRDALHIIAATPSVVTVLNSVVAGAIGALASVEVGAAPVVIAFLGLGAFFAAAALQQRYARRMIARSRQGVRPMFPTPERE
jgi:hypothetical protein